MQRRFITHHLYTNVLLESFCSWFCEKIFCQLCPIFWDVRDAYVDEIWVRLAENQPQKQVQKRLRKYILHSRRFSMFSKNTSTTYKYFFMFVFFSLFLWQSFTIKPEASEIITDPLISMTVGDTKNLYFFHGSFLSLKACPIRLSVFQTGFNAL